MKNQWINLLAGSVRVKAQGKGVERLINACVRNDIAVWNVKKHGDHIATFFILLKDVRRLRIVARKSDCKLYFVGKVGFPFFFKNMLTNFGVFVGVCFFFAIVFMLSNMIWGIDIKGAKPETEYRILKELKQMGVEKGALQFFIDDPVTIQKKLMDRIDNITWIGVELKGTTFYFQVVEKNEPKEPEKVGVRHLVARKKAVITDMFVEKGQPLVSVNDHVTKGQLLVSGIIGKEGRTTFVPARGKIFGETWYKSTVVLPLKATFQVLTGKYMEKHYIAVKNISIPIWGFQKPTFRHYKIDRQKRPLRFWKWDLPIYYERVVFRETQEAKRSYTWEEALAKAKELAREELKAKLPEDAKIKGEKVLHQARENGKVRVELHYQVIENIAIPQPIVQGD
ncbi:sporulation protein YqfD [Parageobacillus thermoglucosidasius]|uniref:Sporulation protein YqfD n=1 Tax=Parageobacillus thermoglucosidasius TaxID=1426 RepID=A0A1B7KWK3_PARTM|nr:sporulation protein YqfD [Parageobacillus thermoglucosidasius]OAT74473.1 sporulation protein YqfD [Parageobacillus thermoglucosidasius]